METRVKWISRQNQRNMDISILLGLIYRLLQGSLSPLLTNNKEADGGRGVLSVLGSGFGPPKP